MKKKILSLILVLMLLPIASLFSACKKESTTDLTALDDAFYGIANENNNIKVDGGNLVFDYSSHEELCEVVDKTEPYVELQKYNEVYNNLMIFTCSYIDNCSVNSKAITAEVKSKVENDLNEFSKAMNNVNENINMFSEIIVLAENNVTDSACKVRYVNLLTSYRNLFQKAINLNNSVSDIYFNKIINNANPDIYGTKLENFDASVVVTKLESRIKYQIACLTESYVEMFIDDDLADRIVNKIETAEVFDLNAYFYQDNVVKLKKYVDIDEVQLTKTANSKAKKETFYNLAIQAQNAQAKQSNDRHKFIVACNAIDYTEVNNSGKASAYEKMCVEIIDQNYEFVTLYNQILEQMMNCLEVNGE